MFVQCKTSLFRSHLSQCYLYFASRRTGSYLTEKTGIRSSGISMDSQRAMGTRIYLSTNTLGTDTSRLHKTGKVTPTFAYPRREALWYVIPWNDTCSPCDSLATPGACIRSRSLCKLPTGEIQASTINFVDVPIPATRIFFVRSYKALEGQFSRAQFISLERRNQAAWRGLHR